MDSTRRGNKRGGVASQQDLVQLVTYLRGHCLCFLLYDCGMFSNYNFIIFCYDNYWFLLWKRFFQSLCSWKFRRASFDCGGNYTSNVRLLWNSWLFCCVSVDKIVEFQCKSYIIFTITLWLLCHLIFLFPTRL